MQALSKEIEHMYN